MQTSNRFLSGFGSAACEFLTGNSARFNRRIVVSALWISRSAMWIVVRLSLNRQNRSQEVLIHQNRLDTRPAGSCQRSLGPFGAIDDGRSFRIVSFNLHPTRKEIGAVHKRLFAIFTVVVGMGSALA